MLPLGVFLGETIQYLRKVQRNPPKIPDGYAEIGSNGSNPALPSASVERRTSLRKCITIGEDYRNYATIGTITGEEIHNYTE